LIEEVTKSNVGIIPVGHVTRDQLVSVTEHKLIYRTERGERIVHTR